MYLTMNKMSRNEILDLFCLSYPILYCLVFAFALLGFSQLSFVVLNEIFNFSQNRNFNFFTQTIVCLSISIGNYRYTKIKVKKTNEKT